MGSAAFSTSSKSTMTGARNAIDKSEFNVVNTSARVANTVCANEFR